LWVAFSILASSLSLPKYSLICELHFITLCFLFILKYLPFTFRYLCTEDYSKVGVEYGRIYTKILMFLQYIIPSVVLLFTYTSIGVVIWCHRIPGEAENSRDQRIARSKTKVRITFFILDWHQFHSVHQIWRQSLQLYSAVHSTPKRNFMSEGFLMEYLNVTGVRFDSLDTSS
jgi:hypothetical protein